VRASPTSRQPLDLVALARTATADIAPLAYSAGYELAFTADAERVAVEGDPAAITRALTNLLSNAIAHAGGSGTIQVHVGADATVDVQDSGPGVPEEERERIFEPFHRVRWDRDGCGLGLHLVREIMRLHGGDVLLLPGPPPGACFRLQFGAVRAA